jgi:hypothetical protein
MYSPIIVVVASQVTYDLEAQQRLAQGAERFAYSIISTWPVTQLTVVLAELYIAKD